MTELPPKNARQRRELSEQILFEHAANNGGCMTWKDVVDLCGYTQTYAIYMLKELHEEGLLHIHKWAHISKHGPRSPVYMVGSGQDAKCPKPKSTSQNRKRKKKYEQEVARALEAQQKAEQKAQERAVLAAKRLADKEARQKHAEASRKARRTFEAIQRQAKKACKEETGISTWEVNEVNKRKREELERLITSPPVDPLLFAIMGKPIPSCHL